MIARLGAIGLVLLALLLAAGCTPKQAYSQATERAFMRSCVAADANDDELEDVCRCSYRRIVRTIPFEEYKRLDGRLRGDPEDLPAKVERIIAACGIDDDAKG